MILTSASAVMRKCEALHTGRPVISNHLHHETRFRTPELLAEHGVRRALNVIMSGEGEAFGVLEVDSRNPGRFTETDVIFLQSVANLLGVGTAPAPPCAKARSRPGS